jgi:hypothetical protein
MSTSVGNGTAGVPPDCIHQPVFSEDGDHHVYDRHPTTAQHYRSPSAPSSLTAAYARTQASHHAATLTDILERIPVSGGGSSVPSSSIFSYSNSDTSATDAISPTSLHLRSPDVAHMFMGIHHTNDTTAHLADTQYSNDDYVPDYVQRHLAKVEQDIAQPSILHSHPQPAYLEANHSGMAPIHSKYMTSVQTILTDHLAYDNDHGPNVQRTSSGLFRSSEAAFPVQLDHHVRAHVSNQGYQGQRLHDESSASAVSASCGYKSHP